MSHLQLLFCQALLTSDKDLNCPQHVCSTIAYYSMYIIKAHVEHTIYHPESESLFLQHVAFKYSKTNRIGMKNNIKADT